MLNDLVPATRYEHRGIAFTTLPRPAAPLHIRVATVNDVHFGETEPGRIGADDRGPIMRAAPGNKPYPELMNTAAVAELLDTDRQSPLAAVIVKGDLTADGSAEQFGAFEECCHAAFGERLFAVRGNHDCVFGQSDFAGDQ